LAESQKKISIRIIKSIDINATMIRIAANILLHKTYISLIVENDLEIQYKVLLGDKDINKIIPKYNDFV